MTRLTLTLLLLSTPAWAQQQQCPQRDLMVAKLAEDYGELQLGAGLADTGVFEVYTNDGTGSWTIILSKPDGSSCLMAAGQFWNPAEQLELPGVDG